MIDTAESLFNDILLQSTIILGGKEYLKSNNRRETKILVVRLRLSGYNICDELVTYYLNPRNIKYIFVNTVDKIIVDFKEEYIGRAIRRMGDVITEVTIEKLTE